MRIPTLIGTALATASTAIIGSSANRSGAGIWYRTLKKPSYVPPSAVFPVAWTTLYADIAVTSASAIDRLQAEGDDAKTRAYIAALGSNLVLNASWSWLFFARQKLGVSAVTAALLAASSADLARRTAQVNPKAGLALTPYPLWCTFATVLSTDIWRLNKLA